MVKCNEGPPSFLRSYVAFTVKSLLGTETLEDLAIFVEHLESLQKIDENLVPPLAAAVIQLGKCRVEDDQDVVVSGLTMSQQHTLFKSKLYNQFTSERLSHRLKAVAADHGTEPEARLIVVRDLLKHTLSEAQKKSLEFAVTMLSPIDDAEKWTFLLESQEKFGFLRNWFGSSDPRLLLEHFFGAKLPDLDVKTFLQAASLATSAIDSIPNTQVKGLLKDWLKLKDWRAALSPQPFFLSCEAKR